MSWSLVVVIENNGDETEVVVPTNWVKEDKVYWSNSFHTTKDFHNMVEPN